MNLTNEKKYLYELVKTEKDESFFMKENKNDETYFLMYEDSVHTTKQLEEYDSEKVLKIATILKNMWDKDKKKELIPLIVVSLKKSKGDVPGRFRNIELNNYMM